MKDNFARRKIFATFITTFLTSMILGFYSVWDEGGGYSHFFLSTFIYFIFSGLVIGVYGNGVSAFLEYVFTKWRTESKFTISLYVLLHVFFGSILGLIPLIFTNSINFSLMLIGGLPAKLFAIADVWLAHRIKQGKGAGKVPHFLLFGLFLLIALTTAVFDKQINPLTEEEAIEYTNFPPTLNRFPPKEGRKTEAIKGYVITRETSADKQEDYTYVVTLKESWVRGNETGYWTKTYEVNKMGATPVKEEGTLLFFDESC